MVFCIPPFLFLNSWNNLLSKTVYFQPGCRQFFPWYPEHMLNTTNVLSIKVPQKKSIMYQSKCDIKKVEKHCSSFYERSSTLSQSFLLFINTKSRLFRALNSVKNDKILKKKQQHKLSHASSIANFGSSLCLCIFQLLDFNFSSAFWLIRPIRRYLMDQLVVFQWSYFPYSYFR